MKPYPAALGNATGPLFAMDAEQWERGLQASRTSPRRRIILPLHRRQDAIVQRMFNFLQPGTYIRPHRHPRTGAVESLSLLQGSLQFLVFTDRGEVANRYVLRAGTAESVIDIEPDVWHSFVVTDKDTVLFEVKRGPYDPLLDKVFAEWAPAEGTAEAGEYLHQLRGGKP